MQTSPTTDNFDSRLIHMYTDQANHWQLAACSTSVPVSENEDLVTVIASHSASQDALIGCAILLA